MSRKLNYQDVNDFLSKCDFNLIRYIELQLGFAKDVRTYKLEYAVSDEDFAVDFGCELNQVEKYMKGALDVSIKDMAKLRTLYAKKIADEKAALQVAEH